LLAFSKTRQASENHFFLSTARDENTTAAATSTCLVNEIFLYNPNIERHIKVHSQDYLENASLKQTFKI
jgi:hypothetical protein